MKLFLLLLPAALLSTASAQSCEAPDNGCSYGMFNFEKCLCECIKPFCPDANGDCVLPLDNCGGNPWEDCTRGVDCPWWGSLSDGGACNTGSTIPPGVWKIYNDKQACCRAHSPNSPDCNEKGPNQAVNVPTTINEDVALDLTLSRLPDDIEPTKVKSTTTSSLNIVLSRLRERVPDLKLKDIYERACRARRLDEQPLLRMVERELNHNLSVCYTVEILTDGSRDYESLIIAEVRASLLDELADALNIDSQDIVLNLGLYGEHGGSGVGGSDPATATMSAGKGGLPGWAIALIVIVVLILTCCIGYFIFAAVRDDKDDKDTVNVTFNSYPLGRVGNERKGNPPRSNPPQRMHRSEPPPRRRRSYAERGSQALRNSFDRVRRGDRSSNARDRPRRRDDGRRRSRPSRYDNFRRSFSDMASRVPRPRRYSRRDTRPSVSFQDPEEYSVNSYDDEIVKDPPMSNALTLYEPNYSKPDPEGQAAGAIVLALTNGEDNVRRYGEEPNTNPKLEPEETANESIPIPLGALPDPSVGGGGLVLGALPDPSVGGGGLVFGVSGDDFGEESSDDDEEGNKYDQYRFKRDQPEIYLPKRKKKEKFQESFLSFATEDPEDGKNRPKKSKKKAKKKKRHSSSSDESLKKANESIAYTRQSTGVESVASSVGSIDLSRASA